MKIGIVGGTGNISRSIARLLVQQSHEVVCFNRGMRGEVIPGVRTILGDRADASGFEQAMQRESFDAAIDMICFNAEQARSSVRAFQGIAHFIQCSTVCTYGLPQENFPITENQKLFPVTDYGRNKVDADLVFQEALDQKGFPVTLVKPSTTYGPQMGMLRQIAWDFSWIDRIRKGKPILICDEGRAKHQFLHVDDAALGFVGIIGNHRCIGQTYNLVRREVTTWAEYHQTAMKVLGRSVPLINVSLEYLVNSGMREKFSICESIFGHDTYYDSSKVFRDIPVFRPRISLEEGMRQVFEAMDRSSRIPDSDQESWEDALIRELMQKR